MIFKEHLNNILSTHLEDNLIQWIIKEYYTNTIEKYDPSKIKKGYLKLLKSLSELQIQSSNLDNIFCIKYLDYDTNDEYSEIIYNETYDCFVIDSQNPNDHYGLSEMDWAELLGLNVKNSCIQRYGVIPVISCILYEISWYGFDYESSKNGQKDLLKTLSVAEKEIEKRGIESFKNFDEVLEELGIPKKSKEEEQKINKILSEVHKKTQESYEKELKIILLN